MPFNLTLHAAIAEISADEWDNCAGSDNPFVSHAFLQAIEESGSAGEKTGWLPRHMALRDEAGVLQAVAPLYVKHHSYGEYVFDGGWAEALERAGGDYYPKLQVAVPFSPVPGPRLLRRKDSKLNIDLIADALTQACAQLKLSSVHITFCQENEWQALGDSGWLQRLGLQFHWQNNGYKSFDDFLAALSSRHRKSLKRERREANGCGLNFITLSGSEIKKYHWDAFYEFYQSTIDRKWGSAYLTRDFFSLLSERLGDKVVLMLAEHNGQPVAGALNLRGHNTLYGRNWGCKGDWPFLHFELCYYRAIDYAIEHGLKRVEAGAQGEHKLQRGYLPSLTYSAHWINNQGLSNAVSQFLAQELPAILQSIEEYKELLPFKQAVREN